MRKVNFLFLIIFLASCVKTQTIHPQRKDIVEAVYASGKIMPQDEYNIYALISGTVIQKNKDDGDTVKAGEILYLVKGESQAALLQAANANYNLAQQNLSTNSPVLNDLKLAVQNAEQNYLNDSLLFIRYSNLLASNATKQIDYDQAKLNFSIAKNGKKSAEEKYYSTLDNLK